MTQGTSIETIGFNSDVMDKEEAYSLWHYGIQPLFNVSPITDEQGNTGLDVDITSYNVGNFLFYETHTPAQIVKRDRKHMAQFDDSDHVLLQTWIHGKNELQSAGQEFIQKPGNISVVNLAFELDAVCTDAEILTVALSREWLQESLPILSQVNGNLFDEDNSMEVRIFYDYVYSLQRNLPDMKQSEIPMLNDNLMAMLESLLKHNDIESRAVSSNTVAVVCNFIDQNLGNPQLTVTSICKHFKCSRATLYRLFQEQGGVREYITRRRLMGCFKALLSNTNRSRKIFEIALDFGFHNPSQFSHAFKEYFGMSASEVREANKLHPFNPTSTLKPVETSRLSDIELMHHWGKSLRKNT